MGMGAVAALATPIALASCGSGSEADSSADTTTTSGPVLEGYVTTWNMGYYDTTCNHWNLSMAPAERFSAAADLMLHFRVRDDDTAVPSRAEISGFESDLDIACEAPKVSDLPLQAAGFVVHQKIKADRAGTGRMSSTTTTYPTTTTYRSTTSLTTTTTVEATTSTVSPDVQRCYDQMDDAYARDDYDELNDIVDRCSERYPDFSPGE